MGIGTSIFLLVLGAILAFAVHARVSGIDVNALGVILMLVGAAGGILSLLFWDSWGGWGGNGWGTSRVYRREHRVVTPAAPVVGSAVGRQLSACRLWVGGVRGRRRCSGGGRCARWRAHRWPVPPWRCRCCGGWCWCPGDRSAGSRCCCPGGGSAGGRPGGGRGRTGGWPAGSRPIGASGAHHGVRRPDLVGRRRCQSGPVDPVDCASPSGPAAADYPNSNVVWRPWRTRSPSVRSWRSGRAARHWSPTSNANSRPSASPRPRVLTMSTTPRDRPWAMSGLECRRCWPTLVVVWPSWTPPRNGWSTVPTAAVRRVAA